MLEHSIIIIQNCTIMKLNEFIENFANQFDDTDVSEITAATEFKALDEWSSLVALSIIAMVEGDDIRNSKTIEDLFNVVASKA